MSNMTKTVGVARADISKGRCKPFSSFKLRVVAGRVNASEGDAQAMTSVNLYSAGRLPLVLMSVASEFTALSPCGFAGELRAKHRRLAAPTKSLTVSCCAMRNNAK